MPWWARLWPAPAWVTLGVMVTVASIGAVLVASVSAAVNHAEVVAEPDSATPEAVELRRVP